MIERGPERRSDRCRATRAAVEVLGIGNNRRDRRRTRSGHTLRFCIKNQAINIPRTSYVPRLRIGHRALLDQRGLGIRNARNLALCDAVAH